MHALVIKSFVKASKKEAKVDFISLFTISDFSVELIVLQLYQHYNIKKNMGRERKDHVISSERAFLTSKNKLVAFSHQYNNKITLR